MTLNNHSDGERHLTTQGNKEAKELGEFISAHNITPELSFCSPVSRTKETLEQIKLSFKFNYPTEFLTQLANFHSKDWEVKLDKIDPMVETLLVVGHYPIIDASILRYTKKRISCSQTGALVSIIFKTDNWAKIPKMKAKVEYLYIPQAETIK